MKQYVCFSPLGEITQIAITSDPSKFGVFAPFLELDPYSKVEPSDYYVVNGALVAKGPKPTVRSQFNYVVGAWYEPPISEAEIEDMRLSARSDRNSLLAACDWTQVADAPVDREAWAAYRQSLRDVTGQDGFPLNIIWPTPPNS